MNHEEIGKKVREHIEAGELREATEALAKATPLDAAAIFGNALLGVKKRRRDNLLGFAEGAAEAYRATAPKDRSRGPFYQDAEYILDTWRWEGLRRGLVEDLVERPPREFGPVLFWLARLSADRPGFASELFALLLPTLSELDAFDDGSEGDDDDPNITDFIDRNFRGPKGLNALEGRALQPWRQPGRVRAAQWIVRCIAEPRCEGSRAIVEALMRRHGLGPQPDPKWSQEPHEE